jgi:hypothetical protein
MRIHFYESNIVKLHSDFKVNFFIVSSDQNSYRILGSIFDNLVPDRYPFFRKHRTLIIAKRLGRIAPTL